MATLTATAAPDRYGVDLVLDAGATAKLVSLTRTDANGTQPVRLPSDTSTFEVLRLTDHECALVDTAWYTATVAVAGRESTVDAAVTLTVAPATWRLHSAVQPEIAVSAPMVTGWTHTRPSSTQVHQVDGRPDPIVNRGVLQLRAGTIEVWTPDYTGVLALSAACESGDTVMLRQNDIPGLDGYIEVLDVAARAVPGEPGDPTWVTSVRFQEVAWPDGVLLAPTAWTLGAALAYSGTFRQALADFPTFRAALNGPVS